MPKRRLFPEPESEKRDPRKRFQQTATKVFSTPKAEVDEREKRWQDERKKPRSE